MTSHHRGQCAETRARIYLEARGLTWIHSNYRCLRGEIDLIMQDKDTLVFVEVRYRRNRRYGDSVETVLPHKQRRLIYAGQCYLMEKQWMDKVNCRFDIIGLGTETDIDWIQNAFEVEY